jgi:ESS family glutamate:Na+ symporter
MLKLNLIHTLAFTGIILFIGYGVRRIIRPLSRYNIPAPVVGGLLVAVIAAFARQSGVILFQFDTTLLSPLMIAFFTTIGFGASLSLLRVGGPQVVLFFMITVVFALVQNIVGMLVTIPFGLHPLFGVLCGSVTLTGGPATGLAFAPLFEQAGIPAAGSVAIAAAMCGIVSGGLIGGPIGTWLIENHKLRTPLDHPVEMELPSAMNMVEMQVAESPKKSPHGEGKESYLLTKCFVAILVSMWGSEEHM